MSDIGVKATLNAINGIDRQRWRSAQELDRAQRILTLTESRYKADAENLLTLLGLPRTLHATQDQEMHLKFAPLRQQTVKTPVPMH